MSEAWFIEKVPLDQARNYIEQGRKPYQFLTANPAALPIFGPDYDEPGSRNQAKKDGRLANTIEEAQAAARRLKTEISAVFFLK